MLNEWTNLVNRDIKPVKMSRNYFCVDCKISTRNPRIYLEHRRDFHRDSMTIHKCTLCVYASKHSQKLSRHMRTVHRDILQSSAHPIVAANVLGQSIVIAPEMVPSSLQCDKSARITTCKICGLYTSNKSILMQHIHTEHPEVKIYKCDQCEYSHYIRDRYNRHHRYHSMNYVQCKLCDFQTIYRWNLERHMRHHVDSISMGFRCKMCNFTASTKQSITAHEIAHHSGLNVVQQQKNNNESIVQTQSASAMNSTLDSTMVNDLIKQNNSDVNDRSMNDDDAVDGASDFDASDFLEIVYDNVQTQKPKILPNSFGAMHSVTVKQENAMELFQQEKSCLNKFFFCVNCHFRNEVNWSQSMADGELLTVYPNLNQPEQQMAGQTVNSRYRCGYCHQASNWKHVIERHCRLVHNTSALIEKFSDENQLFQSYKPPKRRFETCVEATTATATTIKKMVKSEVGETPVTQSGLNDNNDGKGSNFSINDAPN